MGFHKKAKVYNWECKSKILPYLLCIIADLLLSHSSPRSAREGKELMQRTDLKSVQQLRKWVRNRTLARMRAEGIKMNADSFRKGELLPKSIDKKQARPSAGGRSATATLQGLRVVALC